MPGCAKLKSCTSADSVSLGLFGIFFFEPTSRILRRAKSMPILENYMGDRSVDESCDPFDEIKQTEEAYGLQYMLQHRDVGFQCARVYNVFGPHMRGSDTSAVSSFATALMNGETLIIKGDGKAKRSLLHVDDCVRGLYLFMLQNFTISLNFGGTLSFTMDELALQILHLLRMTNAFKNATPDIQYQPVQLAPRPPGPQTTYWAEDVMPWAPVICLNNGLERTIHWFYVNKDTDKTLRRKLSAEVFQTMHISSHLTHCKLLAWSRVYDEQNIVRANRNRRRRYYASS
jgi:UDP-glucuronate decarboxylase